MQPYVLRNNAGVEMELDLCHGCHGIWFDGQESLRMSPEGVIGLFRDLHAHRDDAHTPLAKSMSCPRCRRGLVEGVDVVKSGRYFTYRCPQRHGRFATFASFMIEKGFVRQLTQPEIADLAERVKVISCTNCGAPVDLRKDHACTYCRSALSLLDPQAVAKALEGYQRKAQQAHAGPQPLGLAEALVSIERDRERAKREEQKARWEGRSYEPPDSFIDDLWSIGLDLVWRAIAR